MLAGLWASKHLLYFAGGIAVAIVGKKAIKSDTARNLCVKGMAAGMKLQRNAREAFQNMKEEAVDMVLDAENTMGEE
jgi:hypothetical protein